MVQMVLQVHQELREQAELRVQMAQVELMVQVVHQELLDVQDLMEQVVLQVLRELY